MNAVDVFIFHDDVQYIKSGWVNRNRILVHDEAAWLTLPVKSASHSLSINHRHYQLDGRTIAQLKRRVEASYAKAPMYDEVFPFICDLLGYEDANVASFNRNLLMLIARKLGISCRFLVSSEIDGFTDLKAQDKVTGLCSSVGATTYINPIGGIDLYDSAAFADCGIHLQFLRSSPTSYMQFSKPHIPYLSIIDVLMFNSGASIGRMFNHYQRVEPGIRGLS